MCSVLKRSAASRAYAVSSYDGLALEADAERLDRRRLQPAHHADHDRRVDAAAQERAQRHVADETALDCSRDEIADAGDRFFPFDWRNGVGLRKSNLPERPRACASIRLDRHHGARLELLDALVERCRTRDVAVNEVGRHGVRIGFDRDVRMSEEGLDFRRERDEPVRTVDEQRLLAGPIARDRQATVALVPDRQREHPVELVDGVGALLLVQVDDRFRVALRSEPVAARDETRAQILEVVDLAVEDEPDRAVLVGHRLARVRRQIDDAQPPEAEPGPAAGRDVHAVAVGAAMEHAIPHGGHIRFARRPAVEPQFTADAAHISFQPSALGSQDSAFSEEPAYNVDVHANGAERPADSAAGRSRAAARGRRQDAGEERSEPRAGVENHHRRHWRLASGPDQHRDRALHRLGGRRHHDRRLAVARHAGHVDAEPVDGRTVVGDPVDGRG